jgi:NDP-sugar pyrophosphorylase family protein
VAILAGGLATRLYPVTATIPKALVEVAGKPFILHQLALLHRNGIRRVVVCAGHLGQLIESTLAAQVDLGLEVDVVFDGDRLLGTAGALRAALPRLGDRFFVMYGDSYLRCPFHCVQAAFEQTSALALMTVFRNAGQWDQSNVEYANGRIIAYSKASRSARMQHIDYGLGVLTAQALEGVPADRPFELAAVYEDLLGRGQLAAYEVTDRFYEIGSPAGLAETRAFLGQVAPQGSSV